MPWGGSAGSQVFTRSTGTQTGSTAWQLEDAAGTLVVASKFDTHDQDLADGISECLKKDGGNTASGNLPMGGFKHTAIDDATARDQYAAAGQITDGEFEVYGNTSGTNTYTLSANTFSDSAYRNGMTVRCRFVAANTGAATLNINSIGAADIKRADGSALVAGDIAATSIHTLQYNSTSGDFHLMSQPGTSVFGARTITAGTGLTGGGDLSADRTINLDVGTLTAETGALDRSDSVVIDDDSANATKKLTLDLLAALLIPSATIEYTRPQGTNHPAGTAGNWTKSPLNSTAVRDDGDSLVSISSDVVTLKAGTYVVHFEHVFIATQSARLRWRDTVANADRGTSPIMNNGAGNDGSSLQGKTEPFTITSNTTYELQYYIDAATAGLLGLAGDISGYTERYCRIDIYRVGD